MIAKVIFKSVRGDQDMEAILTDEGRWFCVNKLIEVALDTLCNPRDDGPSTGPIGYRAVLKAASLLRGGVPHFPPRLVEPEGAIY